MSNIKTVLILLLLILTVGIRIPYLQDIPPWSAENENALVIKLLNGEFPLINQNPHIGSLSLYIIAGFLIVFGKHWWVVRLVPFIFGVVTVLFTCRLGSNIFGKRIGLASGILMSVTWYHVIFSSHFPWSNSLTPFFTTAFLLAFQPFTVSGPNGRNSGGILRLGLSGLLFGMAVQTHPEAIVLLPVVPIGFAGHDNHVFRWMKRPAVVLFFLFMMVGYGNMIWYNIITRLHTIAFTLSYPKYALVEHYSAASVALNYLQAFLYLPRMMLGFYDDSIPWMAYFRNPILWMMWIAIIAGIVKAFRKHQYIIPVSFISGILLIPAINKNYTIFLGRYLVFLFPLATILCSLGLSSLWTHGVLCKNRFYKFGVQSGVYLAMGVFLILPIHQIMQYYSDAMKIGETRHHFKQFLTLIEENELKKPFIFLDDSPTIAKDFRQFLEEDGKNVIMFEWDQDGNGHLQDRMFQEKLMAIRRRYPSRRIIAAVSFWNRESFLKCIPIRRILGNIDRVGSGGWGNVYQVYELTTIGSSDWVFNTLIPDRIRTPVFRTESPDQAPALKLSLDITPIAHHSSVQRISARVQNLAGEMEVDICFGVIAANNRIFYYPNWDDIPHFYSTRLDSGVDTGFYQFMDIYPGQLPPGVYEIFFAAMAPNTIHPLGQSELISLSIPL